MILVAGDNAGPAHDLLFLGPNTLVRALAAAVIAGMVSFPRAMLAGVADRRRPGARQLQLPRQAGADRRLLLVAVLVAVAVQSRGTRARGDADLLVRARRSARSPTSCVRSGGCAGSTVLVLGRAAWSLAIVVPLVVTAAVRHLLYATICRVRDLRAVAHRPHRMGRPALARPDGVRRLRRARSRRR